MINSNQNEIVEFQKELDKQFMKIYEQRKAGLKASDDLIQGLIERIDDLKFFLPLTYLRSIGAESKYENLPLMSKWVFGYNQMLGDLYTIIDLSNIINYFLTGSFKNENKSIENEDYILYLRDKSVTNIALVSKTLNMQNANNYKEIFLIEEVEEEKRICVKSGKDFKADIFDKNKISKNEWDLIEAIKSLNNKELSFEEKELILNSPFNENNKNIKLALAMIEKVSLDEVVSKPVFTISITRLVNYLLKLGAY